MTLDKQPHAEKLVVRGTFLLLMVLMLLVIGVVCIGFSVDSFRTGSDTLWGLGTAVGGPVFLLLAVRTAFTGIRADSHGVQITNVWSKHYIPWDEVKDIIINQDSDEGVGSYDLRFRLAEGYSESTFPQVWGSGKLLEPARPPLLRLRDDSLRGGSD